jgi:hypothetical protein
MAASQAMPWQAAPRVVVHFGSEGSCSELVPGRLVEGDFVTREHEAALAYGLELVGGFRDR